MNYGDEVEVFQLVPGEKEGEIKKGAPMKAVLVPVPDDSRVGFIGKGANDLAFYGEVCKQGGEATEVGDWLCPAVTKEAQAVKAAEEKAAEAAAKEAVKEAAKAEKAAAKAAKKADKD